MRRIVLLLILCVSCLYVFGQTEEYKYGKVTKEEVEMDVYAADPDAEAVVLNEKILVYYDISVRDFKLVTEVSRKIKILKDSGKKWGDVEFDYWESTHSKEYISGFNAASYNLVNGKVEKTNLDKKYINTEKLSDVRRRRKFSLPEVKVGTVIEYKYKITSDYIYNVPVLYFQDYIPVKTGYIEVSIPQYLRFNSSLREHKQFHYVRDVDNTTVSGTRITYANEVMKFFVNDMPALKAEPFVWCVNDFRAGIVYEITAIDMPDYKKNFSVDWADVNNALKRSDFASQFKTKNPYKEEVAAIVAATKGNDQECITQILKLVQGKIKWDGTRRLISEDVSKAIKDGAGSSADKNFVLAGALRDAGYDVSAVLMSTREQGRLPLTHASQDKIRTFILRVNLPNGKFVYLDGASIFSNYNILPNNLLVDRARLYDPNGNGEWLDLTRLVQNNSSCYVKASITDNGQLKGVATKAYTNQFVYDFNANIDDYKSLDEYSESVEKRYELKVDSIDVKNRETSRCLETITFTKDVISTDSLIYVNSFPFPMIKDNPFKNPERTMPVEFAYPCTYKFVTELELPAGYVLAEAPENKKVTACKNALSLTYYTRNDSNGKISIVLEVKENEVILPGSAISNISGFYDILSEFSNSQIVLKRQ
ncbi:MAG: DUF3857 domain-containing protein [Bacteroidales bacterium]|nr:DUF3857 domain-containing protein [Bacteroidales bacterium]